MTTVVFFTLVSVIVVSRSVLLAQVGERTNAAVEQELDEFRRFVAEGADPVTADSFDSPQRLIEVYLARQIPDENELMVGSFDDQLVQVDLTSIHDIHPDPLDPAEPLAREVLSSAANSGIVEDADRGTVHWGRLFFTVGEEQREGKFIVIVSTAADRRVVTSQINTLALVGLGGIVMATLIALAVAGQITAPLRRLREVSSSISTSSMSNSELMKRVPVEGPDEIAGLATTINAMLERIEAVVNDQRAFVDDAGHELRTPLTVVRGQLELLDSGDAEQRARSIELATTELDRMARMVNDLLTLAVADSGSFLHPELVDVAELTIDIEDKARTISDRVLLVDAAEGEVELDEQRVTEAVLELVGNAVRYSGDSQDSENNRGGWDSENNQTSENTVDLGSEFRGEGAQRVLRIWVRDRGPGIPAEARQMMFRRFSRGENGKNPAGAGLGLSIVQSIAHAHGGRAFVESTVGLGSIFGLEIPAPTTQPE